ncbi:hypothetical protein [Xanthomarina gelatinilytica]|uniref:hypothetical protein n=1 Tax=Xanthomarina gelatinilytica TaxID=1137281 RepID=UPI003AA89E9D
MKAVVTTIITKDYGHYALTLQDSLLKFIPDIHFCVFVSNGTLLEETASILKSRPHTVIYYDNDFTDTLAKQLKEKYSSSFHDAYRWGMKPILLKKLLHIGYDKAIYVDSDIYFFNDYNFLFKELEANNLLLSPHWRSSDPNKDLSNFKLNFLDGIYNGGFIGASKGAEAALSYWAELCLFNCEVDRANGFYVDQRYLDILPTRFKGVTHIKHKGCNVANWNQVDCERILQPDGNVLINNEVPIIFIHFTSSMFRGVLIKKDDSILLENIKIYRDNLLKYSDLDVIEHFYQEGANMKSRTEDNTKSKSFYHELRKRISLLLNKL